MSELSKQALQVDNNTSFPDNNAGAITPSDLRAFNTNMIDSTVNQTVYNTDSASWNNSIDALEQFTSSQQPTFNALNAFTASQLVVNQGVNAFTQSADARLDALESETQNLELFTASVNQIADNGIVQGTSTRLHFYGLVSASIVPNVGGAIASINIEQDGTKLNSSSFNSYTASTDSDLQSIHQTTQSLNNFTASLQTAFVGTASFNAYTQSNNAKWTNLESVSGSWITESETGSFALSASVAAVDAAQDVRINSLSSQTSSYAISSSVASVDAAQQLQINSLIAATASYSTASVALGGLNAFTASQLVINTGYNTFTQSAQTQLNTLSSATASYAISSSVAAVDAAQQSQINSLIAATGSYATSSANLSSLNAFTASQLTINTGYNTATQSLNTSITNLSSEVDTLQAWTSSINQIKSNGTLLGTSTIFNFSGFVSASLVPNVGGTITDVYVSPDGTKLNTSSFNAYTQSNDTKWSTLGGQTGSYVTSAITASSLVTASVNLNTITFTKGNGTTFNITVDTGSGGGGTTDITSLNEFTASQETKNTTLASVTASLQGQLTNIGSQSASWDNTSLNAYTASNDTKWNNLGSQSGSWITESETGSFARTDVSNTFTQTQNITGDLNVTGTLNVTTIHTITESSSVIFSSGSNVFGDASDDIQTLYGSTRIVNELTASGLNYPTADNGAKSFIQTDGAGNLSLQYVETVYFNIRNMSGVTLSKGTPVYISGSTGDNGNAFKADATNQSTMPATCILAEDLTDGQVGLSIISGEIEGINTTGYPAGSEIYVAEGGGWTLSRPSGSASIVQKLGVVTKEGVGGQGHVINQLEAELPNLLTGYAWVGNGSNQPVQVATSSFGSPTDLSSLNAFTASQETKNTTLASVTSSLNANTASQQLQIDSLIAATGSYITTPLTSLNTFTASQEIINTNVGLSASIYEAKFDTIGTQSGSWGTGGTLPAGLLSSSVTNFVDYSQSVDTRINNIVTGTGFATTGSNTFTGDQNILGTLTASLQEGYVWAGGVGNISTLVATSSFGGGATIDTGSFATTGSNTFIGNQIISGSETIVNYQNTGIETFKLLPFVSSSTFNGNRDTVVIARYATGIDNVPVPASPVNIVFGANPLVANQTTITAQSIVSGSNNIITGTRASATNTAEIQANNSYISVFPSTRTPAYAPARISNSTVNAQITTINSTSALSQSLSLGSVGFAFGYASNVVQSGIFGAITFNPNSGSATFNQGINAGNLTVNSNKVNPDFVTNGSALSMVGNINAANATIIDVASGSYNAGFTQFNRNILGGVVTLTNTREATTNANFQNAIVVGSNLFVTGSDSPTGTAGGGSAFFGRYNLNDGITNNTSNTVFAVGAGTGTGTSAKTPLWVGVDQSVNITGSLKVNGSTIFTGSISMIDRSAYDQNVYLGLNALGMGSAGAQPLAVSNTISVAIGNGAMRFASGSSQNVAIGNNALLMTTGSKNFGLGSEALSSNTTGQENVAIGVSALTSNVDGSENVAIGNSAGFYTSGSANTFIGHNSGQYISGSYNTIVGRYTGTAGQLLNNNIVLADGQNNVKAQYSGSAWSLQGEIKLNVGSNKPADIVSVGSSGTTVSNSLVTANSIILLTTQNSGTSPIYPAVVTSKGTGTFDIKHSSGDALNVAYLIINPTT